MVEQYSKEYEGTVLLMLDNKCPPPCYYFENGSREICTISPEILDAVLTWVSQFKPSSPGTLYMVGDPCTLDKEVQEMLEAVADSVICTPMNLHDQKESGLPFSETQLVVFSSLKHFEKEHSKNYGRSSVVHIDSEEIPRMFEVLQVQATKNRASKLRLRPKNLHLWDRSDLMAYTKQITELEALQYRLNATGASVYWELSALEKCPAMRSLVTIGPDGLCYPCPTFYYAGQTNGIGAIETLTSDIIFLQSSKQTCQLCQSECCEACLFWESGLVTGKIAVCECSTLINKYASKTEVIRQTDSSGYMFASLQAEKTNAFVNSVSEFCDSLWSASQIDDISFNDFTSALRSLYEVIHEVMKGSTEVSKNLIAKYENLIRSAPKSEKQLYSYEQFAKELEEILQNTEPATEEATGEFDWLISQYESKPVKLALTFRKTFFFEKVKEILLDLVELSEAAKKDPLPLRSVLDNSKEEGISDVKEEDEAAKLLLSKQEVVSIRQIYETFLGWNYLHENVVYTLNQGFEIDKEIVEIAKKESSESKRQMQCWFDQASKRHRWAAREGYIYNVDFESNLNVSDACYKKILHTSPKQKAKNWTPVMELDGIEKEVFERVTMLIESSLVTVKQLLTQYFAGLDVEREMKLSIRTLGQNILDRRRWFFGMSRELNWPPYSNWRVQLDRVEGR